MKKVIAETHFEIACEKEKKTTYQVFVDVSALIAEKISQLQAMTTKLYERVRLNSTEESKIIQIVTTPNPSEVEINQQNIVSMRQIPLLGSTISQYRDAEASVRHRPDKASAVFQRMRSVWRVSLISMCAKPKL